MPRERHKWKLSMRLNIKAGKDGGWCCSSEETFVMKVEPRASIISLRMF
jgi:hypothetical protein